MRAVLAVVALFCASSFAAADSANSISCSFPSGPAGSCFIHSDQGVVADGTLAWSGGPVSPESIDSVLGYGPWDNDAFLSRYQVIAVYNFGMNLQVSYAAGSSGVPDSGKITGTINLPDSPFGWLVTGFGLSWDPGEGGNANYGEGTINSSGGGGANVLYGDSMAPFFIQGGKVTTSLSTAIPLDGGKNNSGFGETLLDLAPVPVSMPEPVLWPVTALFLAGLLLSCKAGRKMNS